MTQIPPTIRPAWERAIKRAQRSISTGSIPVDVVDALITMVVTQHEEAREQERTWRERERFLEREIVMCGGGFDRRGLDTERPGYIVQYGIHPVIEDAP